MKISKFFGIASVAGLAALALTSCGGTNSTTAAPTQAPTGTPTVQPTGSQSITNNTYNASYATAEGNIDVAGVEDKNILFYNTCGENLQTVINGAIATFQEKFPGWTVTSTQIGGYDDVYSTCVTNLQAGTQPDIAYAYPDHVATYMTSKKVLDYNTLINSKATVLDGAGNTVNVGYTSEEVADFVEGYLNEGRANQFANYANYGYKDDCLFTLPFSKSTELMYFNETALIGAGYVNDDGSVKLPQTWDEMWEYCEKLSTVYPLATPLCYDSAANWVINTCQQNGWNYTSAQAPYYTFKNDNNLANWLDQLSSYYNDYLYFETQDTYGGYTSALFTKGVNDGGCIFCIGSSGGASYQATENFKWGVAPIPGSKRADGSIDKSVISQGPSLVMFDTESDEKELMSWLFVKEILEPAFQAAFSMTSGYNPVRLSSYEIPNYATWLEGEGITAVAARVSSTLRNNFFTSPVFPGSAQARIHIGDVLTYVILGEKTGKKALEDAYKACGGK